MAFTERQLGRAGRTLWRTEQRKRWALARRAFEQDGDFASLLSALYDPLVSSGRGASVRVPRWAAVAAWACLFYAHEEYSPVATPDAKRAMRRRGRHSKFSTRFREELRDRKLFREVEDARAKGKGSTLESAIAAVAGVGGEHEDTVRKAHRRFVRALRRRANEPLGFFGGLEWLGPDVIPRKIR